MCINNLLSKFLLLLLLKMENPPSGQTTLWWALRKTGARAPDCPVGASLVSSMMANPTLVASFWWYKDTSWSQDCKPWSLWELPFFYHKIRSLSTSRFHFTSTEGRRLQLLYGCPTCPLCLGEGSQPQGLQASQHEQSTW